MTTHPLPVAGKLPIKLWLLGNYQQACMCAYVHARLTLASVFVGSCLATKVITAVCWLQEGGESLS